MAQSHLLQWEEWQQEGFPPTTQAEEDGMEREEIKEFFAALNQDEPQASPLTPAVQQDVLSSRHLPPTTLPSFGTRVPGNLSSDSSTHLRSAKASHIDRDTDLRAELQEVIQQNRVLEENQTALLRGAAPTSPPPMSHGLPNSGLMSPLTIHQPFPSMATGDTRGPWSTTRDRIQQQQLQHHPGTTISSGVPGSEPSLGPLSGGASAGVPSISPTSVTGMAYLAVAVAQPHLVSPTEMPKDDFKREKLSLPKLSIKAGDATTLTRTINEWLQKTTLALNTWSFSAVQLWHQAVNTARQAHQQWTSLAPSLRALQTGLPSMGNALPMQLSVLEATMRAELLNHSLPDKVSSLAVQKSASTVADILFLTLQTYLPSEPSARVDGLTAIEAPVRPARTFNEALSFLRSWRQQILTVVHDLKGNPEPLKLLNSLKTLISSLIAGDTAFAMEVSQMYRQTNVKTVCTDVTFLAMLDLLEIELSSRAHEDDEEKRRQNSANVAIAASVAAGKGSGKGKPTTKPTCRDYLTDNGCTRGGQCSFLHPPTVGRCLRCGSTKHAVADCKRPRQEKTASPPKGKGKSSPPKAPPPKANNNNNNNNNKGGGKGNAGAKAKNQSKPKGEATPKPKAEAGHIEIDWASQTHSDPFASSSVAIEEVAMHLAEGTFLQSDHAAFTFYTTFLPSFHSTSATDESGVLPPILDTGATHCLLPLSWLSPEEASSSKRIHLKVASGTSVRALLYNNVIYCSTVSRPLISVGQLKAMLDLRFHWDDSSPTLLVCSGGLKYILLEASVVHHLPVISSEEMMAILEAIHCFTSTGKMWNAKMWEEKLQRSLLIFHEFSSHNFN